MRICSPKTNNRYRVHRHADRAVYDAIAILQARLTERKNISPEAEYRLYEFCKEAIDLMNNSR